jgi:hypothetical protein
MLFIGRFKELGYYRSYYGNQEQDTTYACTEIKDKAK